jgi:hypothetical protein
MLLVLGAILLEELYCLFIGLVVFFSSFDSIYTELIEKKEVDLNYFKVKFRMWRGGTEGYHEKT